MVKIDQYSVSTVPLEMFFGETFLSLGTGFFWRFKEEIFLITNWHNVSGKNPTTGKHLSPTLAEPDRLRVWWNVRNQLGNKAAVEHTIRDHDGTPLWLVHPQHRRAVDVVALPIVVPANADPYPINEMEQDDLLIQVGMDVFVLGYPFGIGPAGLPVWKRGSIAVEPQVAEAAGASPIFIDTASRPGMSGSPVIRRSWGIAQLATGDTSMGITTATKFIGIYSGRIEAADPLDAQLGMMWPAKLINEIVSGQLVEAA